MANRILLLGATSTIMRQVALNLIGKDDKVCLAARNTEELAVIAADLRIRTGAALITTHKFDTSDFATHQELVETAQHELGGLDIVVAGTGALGDQLKARQSLATIKDIIDSNYVGIATTFSVAANILEQQGSGCLCVLSSVAGDRGRQSNYLYGSAKSGMSAFMQGLRNRLAPAGVRVITIKLGFIDTKMVAGKSGTFLMASPEAAGAHIAKRVREGADVVYFPFFWRYIMLIIRNIPEFIFKRMKL
ncbi:Short-chain dehydrogenase [Duganella sp. CF458]|uniref:SDR family NAD(P)-dependent oxidoreductase n=1 Tax=Duganella sp. CF458 TaxID=1884368 RepID=UPI0008E2C21C|nr:SDR family NAD(P)-dependent oxidoreductase [Duganella sp. CF458]SFG20812.1 Short-chain dehydrogenase [Duganella sp. CF458]